MGMIADLLSQQQQWQQRQSESEQLIARMAEKLEHSQKSIDTLTGMLSETGSDPRVLSSTSGHARPNDHSPDLDGQSWESQKQNFIAGCDSELPAGVEPTTRPISVADEPRKPSNADADNREPVTASVSSTVSPEEMNRLGDCDNSDAVRRLRQKLEEKLRDAEIEISIERARIHRARRELEQQRIEFEREVIKARDEDAAKGKKRSHRWARFLGESNA